ncbi:hypothetical protein F4779DRAFT_600147 [Xylariaceae sp. FL0662B]|nr:hypothetical protein F4779DRAFT_600147 [Xylariaceae sp. FL0662B]
MVLAWILLVGDPVASGLNLFRLTPRHRGTLTEVFSSNTQPPRCMGLPKYFALWHSAQARSASFTIASGVSIISLGILARYRGALDLF